MKRLAFAVAVLLSVGVGCASQPVVQPQPIPAPAPQPTSSPDPHGPEAKSGLIAVDSPASGDYIQTPLTVTGKARGSWYFEASFPVRLLDGHGNLLASGPAQAQGDWMTTDFVPFKITLPFVAPGTAGGTLLLMKDNPSGLPEKDDYLSLPIRFNYGIVPPPQR